MAIALEDGDSVTTVLSGTITSSAISNPGEITMSASHLLATGDSVLIAGHSGSTPSINGRHFITVIDPDEFSLDGINITVGGTGGTISVIEQILFITTLNDSNLRGIRVRLTNLADGDQIIIRAYVDEDGAGDYVPLGTQLAFRDAQERSVDIGPFLMIEGGKFTVESFAGAAVAVPFKVITGET